MKNFSAKKIENIISLLLSGMLLCFVVLKFYTILVINAPRELREATLAIFSQSFANGINPYAVNTLESVIPSATSMYGFLVPLILAPFVKVTSILGLGALQTCQIVTLIVEVIGLYYGYKIVYFTTNRIVYAIGAAVVLYSCYWRYDACGGAFPDQWGVTLSIILAYIVYLDRKREKYRSILYAVLIVGLFYIKPYFVFVTFGLIFYLWIYARKESLKLIIAGACIGGGSFLLVDTVFPLYFSQILPNGAGQTFNCGLPYSIKQILESATKYYLLLTIVIIIYLINVVYEMVISIIRKEQKEGMFFLETTKSFAFCEFICILPIVIIIARNGGTYYTYYLQLWWTWGIIFCFEIIENVITLLSNCTGKKMQNVSIVIIFISIFMCKNLLISTPLNEAECADWEYVYSVLDNYSQKGEVLVSAHLSSWCIDNNIVTAEYGQQEFNNIANLNNYNNKVWWNKVFPLADDIIIKSLEYNGRVEKNIVEQKYSCIVITDTTNYGIEEKVLEDSGYYILDERNLLTGTWEWKTRLYVCD